MANNVFANGREISCKKADGKSICAFPDVCFTPPDKVPPTPPGVPIPYPNTGMAKDTTGGSKKVKISGKEIILKNKSHFKKSTGNEAGCATKKGIMTSKTTGKSYFTAWSMDVKVEGENVVRHMDLTTHNHGSNPNTAPWPYLDAAAIKKGGACANEAKKEKEACGGKSPSEACRDSACQKARKCMLMPYGGSKSPNCCPPQVAHHIIPNSLFQGERNESSTNVGGLRKTGKKAYTLKNAPCVCTSGKKGVSTPIGTHKKMHDRTKAKYKEILEAGKTLTYADARDKAIEAHRETFQNDEGKPCSKKCLAAQIDAHMEDCGTGSEIKVHQKDGATNADYSRHKKNRGGGP